MTATWGLAAVMAASVRCHAQIREHGAGPDDTEHAFCSPECARAWLRRPEA
jgi:hypothetical protein